MGHSERPLARIAQSLEETEAAVDDVDATMEAAEADGVISLDEWRAVRRQVRGIKGRVRRANGRVTRHDLEDAYGLAVARNGYHNDRVVRLRRQLVALPPLDDDDPENDPPAAIAA